MVIQITMVIHWTFNKKKLIFKNVIHVNYLTKSVRET